MKSNVTDDKRFGELIQQNDNSGKNHQLDVFIFEHFLQLCRCQISGVRCQ
jgi:hypothetical protein